MVELVLHAARLEAQAVDRALGMLDHDRGRAAHVGGQVGNREAALAGDLGALRLDDPRVDEHQQAVVRVGLRVSPHVDRDHPCELSDLRGGQPDAALERSHRVEQVASDGLGVAGLRGRRHLLQHRVRVDEDFASGHWPLN